MFYLGKNRSIDLNNNNIIKKDNLKRKLNNSIKISDDSSNDCKIIKKTRALNRIYSIDDSSSSSLSVENVEFGTNESNQNDKKIVMKLIRKENSQNFMSVSCSEEDLTKTRVSKPKEHLPRIASVSSITSTSTEPKKVKSLHPNKSKIIPTNSSSILKSKEHLSPDHQKNFIKKNIEDVSKKKSQPEILTIKSTYVPEADRKSVV